MRRRKRRGEEKEDEGKRRRRKKNRGEEEEKMRRRWRKKMRKQKRRRRRRRNKKKERGRGTSVVGIGEKDVGREGNIFEQDFPHTPTHIHRHDSLLYLQLLTCPSTHSLQLYKQNKTTSIYTNTTINNRGG